MKKCDFRSGLILEFDDGNRGLVLDQEVFLFRKDTKKFSGSLSLSFYNDKKFKLSNYRLMAVYQPNTPRDTNIGADINWFMSRDDYKRKIWTRPDPEEMTLEEVCKELGREIKIVR